MSPLEITEHIRDELDKAGRSMVVYRANQNIMCARIDSTRAKLAMEHPEWIIGVYTPSVSFTWLREDIEHAAQ